MSVLSADLLAEVEDVISENTNHFQKSFCECDRTPMNGWLGAC